MDCTVDQAYKFGCGRYIQRENAIECLGEEVRRAGSRALVISGATAWEAAGGRCEESLKKEGCSYQVVIWKGYPCEQDAEQMAREYAEEWNVVVGVGGGRIMDFVKIVAEIRKCPVINVPTVSATCAAFTPLSVVYSHEGKTIGSWFYRQEVQAVIVDETILSGQPLRYLAAGIMDSVAKMYEIRHYLASEDEKLPYDLALSRLIANHIGKQLTGQWEQAVHDLAAQKVTDTLKNFYNLLIPQTGIVSGCARGARQSALGHALYEQIRVYYTGEAAQYLHGEIVGIGLRMQLAYLNDTDERKRFEYLMEQMKAPKTLREIGVELTEVFIHNFTEHVIRIGMVSDTKENRSRIREALQVCDR